MKHARLFILLCMLINAAYAQSPQGISYQAIARNNTGSPLVSQAISVRFKIHNITAGGTVVYSETHNTTTNSSGLFTLSLGQGTVVTGTFATIDWSNGAKFLQVELDPAGGTTYTDMGTQQMLSVPYALYANSSGSSTSGWGVNGNSGTTNSNFIGTTDSVPLNLKVNNQKSGVIDPGKMNTAFGTRALNVTTGTNNTAFGYVALKTNTSGANNTAIGDYALNSNTTGSSNTASGSEAMKFTTSGLSNTAYGASSLHDNTVGSFNVAFGSGALMSNVAGTRSTAIGYNAMQNTSNSSTGFFGGNVAVGYEALKGLSPASGNTGNNNTAMGYQSMTVNSTGENNTANGFFTLSNNSTGSNNSAYGYSALNANISGWDNAVLGAVALAGNTIGNGNVAIGKGAMNTSVSGTNGVAVGRDAMFYANNTTSSFVNKNVAVGFEALRGSFQPSNNTGNINTAIGYQALLSNSSGSINTAVGNSAMINNTSGTENAAYGSLALLSNSNGGFNTAIGDQALYWNIAGSRGTAIGWSSMFYAYNSTVPFINTNVAIGYEALLGSNTPANNSGLGNLAVGYQSLHNNSSGESNCVLGNLALQYNSTGSFNTSVGAMTGQSIADGSLNTFVGYGSGAINPSLTNATAIGANASVSASNALILGNGVNVGIGNTNPLQKLDITGGNVRTTGQFISTVSSGTPPLTVSSNSLVQNLNADLLDGVTGAFYQNASNINLGILNPANGGTGSGTAFIPGSVVFAIASGQYFQNNSNFFWDNAINSLGIGTNTPKSNLEVNGTFATKVKTAQVAGTNHPDNTATIWIYNSGAGTITFPPPVITTNRIYTIVNQQNVSVSTSSYRTMTTAGTSTSIAPNSSISVVSDGVQWLQVK